MKLMKSQSSTMQLAYHWKALSAHTALIIQVTLALEIVAGIRMALRDVVSRFGSGPHQEGELGREQQIWSARILGSASERLIAVFPLLLQTIFA